MPRARWRLLHLSPHLGGGVGRALVSLAQGDRLQPSSAPKRTVWCLEPPQKSGALAQLRALGVDVVTAHDDAALARAAAAHDLVPAAIALSAPASRDDSSGDNAAELAARPLTRALPVFALPRAPVAELSSSELLAALARLLLGA